MSEPENNPPLAYEQYDASVDARCPSSLLLDTEEWDPAVLDIALYHEALSVPAVFTIIESGLQNEIEVQGPICHSFISFTPRLAI
jgi:hypothetical protein